MSGRKGDYVNVDDALNAIADRAMMETRKRNPEADQSWIESVGEIIAVAALRYSLVSQDLDKVVVFDFDEALRLDGETGPYLLYSFARACRIIEKAGTKPLISERSAVLLNQQWEVSLILSLAKLSIRIEEAALNLSPKNLAKYAFFLSAQFNTFYERSPVLQERDPEVRNARLALVYRFKESLGIVAKFLGIDTPEKI
jgi:arginyl-tRNA synthetase